jgi:hypothetical protein
MLIFYNIGGQLHKNFHTQHCDMMNFYFIEFTWIEKWCCDSRDLQDKVAVCH